MLNNLIQRVTIILSFAAAAALLVGIFMLARPHEFWRTMGEIHDGIAAALTAIGYGVEIVFFLAVLFGAAYGVIRLNQMRSVTEVGPSRYGQKQAVIVRGRGGEVRVEHLANTEVPIDATALLNALRQSMQANYASVNTVIRQQKALEAAYDYEDGEVVDEHPQLPAPKKMVTLSDVLRSGASGENEYIIGYRANGEPLQGKLFEREKNLYNGLYVVGDQGQGKSSLAVLVAAYTIQAGGRLLVIDPEMGDEQSLTSRLGPLAQRELLLHDIANTPEKAATLLDIADAEMKNPSPYPVALLVDELSMIARNADDGFGEWAVVGKRILSALEDWSTRGRKRRRRPVVMGQFTQGKRAGGTTLRYAMATVCFKLKKKQAQLALEEEDAAQTETLQQGEAIILPDNVNIPKDRVQVVYPDTPALTMIAQIALELLDSEVGSSAVQDEPDGELEPDTGDLEPGLNRSNRSLEPAPDAPLRISPELAHKARVRRVRELRRQGCTSQTEIIERIWGVKKGGSDAYSQARDEYLAIMQEIALEDTRAQA
jgi:hypothetical protein